MATIAVIFDFDDTLLPDSSTQLLLKFKIDPKKFWGEEVKALVESGFDPAAAYLKLFLSNIGEDKAFGPLTNKDLRKFGEEIEKSFYPALPVLFNDVRDIAKKHKNIDVKFYIISGGLQEIIEGTNLAKKHNFSGVYGAQLAGDSEDGVLKYVKRCITFTEKTRYIFEINKGITPEEGQKNPYLVNQFIAKDKRPIPLSNMIYVGDGLTDIPCFSLLSSEDVKGYPFGVFNPEDSESAKRALKEFLKPDRVISMHAPKYEKKDELGSLIRAAVAIICSRITISEQLAKKLA